ncbi:MAG: hypothetical protein LBS91_00005 [Clostridiales Family XIII bacterium]|jgi:hypothetical protein|nr:hypothetical protein [Clostridiales Family XIII bacterium]
MKAFTIRAEWIKEVRDGHNTPWDYDYKEYVFNDRYTDAYCLRIPQNAYGIKAQMISNDSGIKEEYARVYLDNGEVGKLFEIDPLTPGQRKILALEKELSDMRNECDELREALAAIRRRVYDAIG